MRIAIGVLFGVLLCIFTASPAHIQKQTVRAATATKVALAQHQNEQSQPENAAAVITPAPQPVLNPNQQLMQDAGIAESDWPAVDYIVSHESGWCQYKWEGEGYCPPGYAETYSEENQHVGYGLCQSTPAIKMASAASDWRNNAVTQLKWCSAYAQSRYGGWQAAQAHWQMQIAAIGHGNW